MRFTKNVGCKRFMCSTIETSTHGEQSFCKQIMLKTMMDVKRHKETMYKEQLTIITGETCPPVDATLPSDMVGYRLVRNTPPVKDDFLSHAALGKIKPPDVDECRWRSCSLAGDKTKLVNLNGLPKIKGAAAIVKVSLNNLSGMVKLNQKNTHIDLWMFTDFDPLASTSVEMEFK